MILYDANVPGEMDRAEAFGNDILRLCVEVGGVLTGEHGVGIEKRDLMPVMFGEEDLKQQQRVKCAFDPDLLLNPGKVFPTLHRRAELVLTVRPGTPLADVQALVAGEGQMLAFEPWGGAGSTIGGTVAAGVAGSRRVTAGRLLNRCGHDVIFAPGEGCCGALVHHMGREGDARDAARRNVDAWMREIEGAGRERIPRPAGSARR